MSEWKQYRRTNIAEMREVTDEEIKSGQLIVSEKPCRTVISVSQADKDNGSPKKGDRVARNPQDHADQWLVAKEYFEQNFEEHDK